jgi:hypothetical protein
MPDFEVIRLEIEKMMLSPGDTFIVRLPSGTDPMQVRAVEDYTRGKIPEGVKLLVISDRVELGIVKVEPVVAKSKRK